MQLRELPAPRDHIMIDFIGPFLKGYYILTIVDYASGYTMLESCVNCGAEDVIDMLIDRWISIFGLPKYFESDLGSAFIAQVTKWICKLLGVKQLFSEPRYHQGTGKVERVIGLIQQIIKAYNVESNRFFYR